MEGSSDNVNPYQASELVATEPGPTRSASRKFTRIYLFCHLVVVMGVTFATLLDTGMPKPAPQLHALVWPVQLLGTLGMLFLLASPLVALTFLVQTVRGQGKQCWALFAELGLWGANVLALLPLVQ